jgi:hypothetical protein
MVSWWPSPNGQWLSVMGSFWKKEKGTHKKVITGVSKHQCDNYLGRMWLKNRGNRRA